MMMEFFEREELQYAVVGGIGLHAYGLSRTTRDLDFVTESRSQEKLVLFLESTGFRTLHLSPAFSNHRSDDAELGRVDFVYVRGETSSKLFSGCRKLPVLPGRECPVPRPEHLAAMKVNAMKNDPARALQDLADVRFLLELPGVDESEIRSYFEREGLEA